jgi:hypothetical protein
MLLKMIKKDTCFFNNGVLYQRSTKKFFHFPKDKWEGVSMHLIKEIPTDSANNPCPLHRIVQPSLKPNIKLVTANKSSL